MGRDDILTEKELFMQIAEPKIFQKIPDHLLFLCLPEPDTSGNDTLHCTDIQEEQLW